LGEFSPRHVFFSIWLYTMYKLNPYSTVGLHDKLLFRKWSGPLSAWCQYQLRCIHNIYVVYQARHQRGWYRMLSPWGPSEPFPQNQNS
jgi:hypothetical protein